MSGVAVNSINTLVRQIVSVLVQLFSMIIIARELGVESNGKYALAILLPTFLAMFVTLGLNASNIYFIGKKTYSRSVIYSTSMIMSIVIILIGLLVGFSSIYFFGGYLFPNMNYKLLYLALFIFPFSFVFSIQLSFLQAIENFSDYNLVSLFRPILFFLFIITLYITGNLTLKYVVFISIVNPFLSFLFALYFISKNNLSIVFKSFSKKYMSRSLNYGIKSHLTNLVAFINYRADIFLLNFFSNPVSVGIYYVSIQIVERLWILSSSMSIVLFPRFVNLLNNDKERIDLVTKSFRLVIVLTFLASVLMIFFGMYFINVMFGVEYSNSYLAILCLIPGVVLGAGSRILANSIAATGRPELNMYTSFFVMLLNIILNIILIPKFGYLGAAISTSISYSINLTLRIWLINRIEYSFKIKNLIVNVDDFKFIYLKSKAMLNKYKQH